ncbi:MAG: universal stress protein [Candidatus Thorarchaeota archaeon]|nr:universal stress protein [Candidatus Thorarchaeota archaeon]
MYCEPGRIFCRSKKIMLAVDGNERSARAATVAFEIAEMTGSELHIMHVIPLGSVQQLALMTDDDVNEIKVKYTKNGNTLVEGYKKAAEEFGIKVELILDEGLPSDRIIAYANDSQMDLVVIGARGESVGKRKVMGSATERVANSCKKPIQSWTSL